MKQFDLQDKTVFVTGAASGIGFATCQAFAKAGAKIIATDITEQSLNALQMAITSTGGVCKTFALDVTDHQEYQRLADQLAEQGVVPDVLVNNAGIAYLGDFLEQDLAVWQRVLNVNVLGVVNGCHAFLPKMRDAGRQRCIVNVASLASVAPMPNMSAYAASKYAVHGLSDVLSLELAGSNISVVCVHPGIINTNIVRSPGTTGDTISDDQLQLLQQYYVEKGCLPDVVAADILNGVLKRKSHVYTGPLARTTAMIKRFISDAQFRALLLKNARAVGYLEP